MIAAYSAGFSSQAKWPAWSRRRLLGQSLVQELRVGHRHDAIVVAVDDRDRCRDLRQQLGERGKLLGVPAYVTHRLDVAVTLVAGEVVLTDVVGNAANNRVQRGVDGRAQRVTSSRRLPAISRARTDTWVWPHANRCHDDSMRQRPRFNKPKLSSPRIPLSWRIAASFSPTAGVRWNRSRCSVVR